MDRVVRVVRLKNVDPRELLDVRLDIRAISPDRTGIIQLFLPVPFHPGKKPFRWDIDGISLCQKIRDALNERGIIEENLLCWPEDFNPLAGYQCDFYPWPFGLGNQGRRAHPGGSMKKESAKKSKEIGIPKNAPASVKRKDDAYDKKNGLKEGSKADLAADRKLVKQSRKGAK